MNILITESPSENGYIESLINAYTRAGHTVICDVNNFYFSGYMPDILHIHWPERLYKWHSLESIGGVDIYKTIKERLLWYKEKGTKIIHTIHNLNPHDSNHAFEEDIYQLIIEYADILVHHCNDSINFIIDRCSDASQKINIVCPHGDYLIHYKIIDQSHARQQYNIPSEKIVILNFGKQRPYKNENFIKTVIKDLECTSKCLLVAGRFENPGGNSSSRLYFRARNRIRKQFEYSKQRYIYRQIPTDEIPAILCSSDIVFLGQQHGLNSGLLSLAATYSKPVVCPDIGCFHASLSGWNHETYNAGNIADAVRALDKMCARVIEIKKEAASFDNSLWLTKHSWDRHVKNILLNASGNRP